MADHSKRVLITGITGFTGQFLHRALEDRGHIVQGLSRGRNNFLQVTMDDASGLKSVIADFDPTHVVHLAGLSFPAHPTISEIYDSNVSYTAKLLDALIDLKHLRQVIVVSSAAVYGQCFDELPIIESCPIFPLSHYALSKVFVEQMSEIYSKELPILIVRPFNYVGVGQSDLFFVPKIVQAFITKAPSLSLGNLDIVRDFSDVRDVVEVYVRLIEADVTGTTLNICSGIGTPLAQIISDVSDITGYRLDVQCDLSLVRPNEPKIMIGSNDRLSQTIGPRTNRSMTETLKWIVSQS